MEPPHELMFEEEVYLAFKDIFVGSRAEFRKAKSVLRIVNKYQNHGPVRSLLQTTDQQVLCDSLCRLLKDRVFQYEAIAIHRFANNPRTAVPAGPVVAESPASELTFLRAPNSASDLAGAEMMNGNLCPEREVEVLAHDSDFMDEDGAPSESSGDTLEEHDPEIDTPAYYESRYPTKTSQLQVSLPLRVQNIILSHMQVILELACFEFAKEKMPKILESRKWRCPKAGELNLWVREFNKKMGAFKSNTNNPGGYEISTCFQTAVHIRHYAVHRRDLSMAQLQSLVNNAEGLCKILGSNQALAQIELIWGYAQAQISELESLKQEIVVDLESSLDDIAARRAELDRLEAVSIAKAHDKLNGHHDVASDELEKILLDRHMVLMAAGKVEVEEEQDEAGDKDCVHVPEEMDDQPPEEAKVEQHQPPSGALHGLQQRIKASILLAQEIYNRLNSLATCLRTIRNPLLWLSFILLGMAAAYILGPGGMEHMWSVFRWGEW